MDSEGVLNSCEVDFSTLKGKILAVDVSIWLYQFVKSVPSGKDVALPPLVIGGLFQRVCKLLHFGIKPVFVFDGSAPALKKETIVSRQELRRKGDTDYAKLAKKILKSKLKLMALEEISGSNSEYNPSTPPKPEVEAPPIDFLSLLESPEGSDIDEEDEGYVDEYSNYEIDTGSLEFKKLPYEIQEQILLESRKRTIDSLQLSEASTDYNTPESPKKGDNALDFSKAQVEALIKRRKLMDELETLRGNSTKKATDSKSISHGKIASSSKKQYIFAKNAQAGWSLTLTDSKEPDDDSDEVSSFAKPVKEEKRQPTISDIDDDDEFMKMMFGTSQKSSALPILNKTEVGKPGPIEKSKAAIPFQISEDESEIEEFDFNIPSKKEIADDSTMKSVNANEHIKSDVDICHSQSPKLILEDTVKLPEIISDGLVKTSSDEITGEHYHSENREALFDYLSSEEGEIDTEYRDFIEEVSSKSVIDKSKDFKELVDKLQNELKEFNALSEASTLTSVSPTKVLIDAFMEMLHHFRLPFLIAPFEAEAQCSAISGVHGVISDDSDCLLFGAEAVYKGFFGGGKGKKSPTSVSRITMSKITEKTKLNKNDLIVLAHLLGCDYCIGIEGIGPKRALELVRQTKSDEPYEALQKIVDLSEDHESKYHNWLKGKVTSNFIDNRVAQAFINPIVNPISVTDLKWGKIDQGNIERFMTINAKWAKEKTSRHIIDVEKKNKG